MNLAKRDPLGSDPFSQSPISKGIFSKTTDLPHTETIQETGDDGERPPAEIDASLPVNAAATQRKTRKHKPESVKQKTAIDFLDQDQATEKITLQIPTEWNDLIDQLVRESKKRYGAKIKKQTWIRAAIELLMSSPLDLSKIDSIETFRLELQKLSAKMNEK